MSPATHERSIDVGYYSYNHNYQRSSPYEDGADALNENLVKAVDSVGTRLMDLRQSSKIVRY
jgi:hypothetical protein